MTKWLRDQIFFAAWGFASCGAAHQRRVALERNRPKQSFQRAIGKFVNLSVGKCSSCIYPPTNLPIYQFHDRQLNILQTVVSTDSHHAAFRVHVRLCSSRPLLRGRDNEVYGQASRLISIGKLNTSPCLHIRPITWSSSRSL